ncbi:hypothetical protein GYMLUDRAFT_74690 [Collybiopsis luxurians FD-317 M1]|uniref:Uncharacterized protein n=1 Tax=Collybiopsis luxurians FD-317 M1 TaxID=944289 RepID=A0A0D0BUK1_9AGAR|nr:hypothetical protein GYMLUDRAFT_74690 [Collybiopsis luxurians FD-317 M1]
MTVFTVLLPSELRGKLCIFDNYAEIDAAVERNRFRRGCLIVGSPGIGKSTYLLYKLSLQLSQRKPTFYYSYPALRFFNDQGAFEVVGQVPDLFFHDDFQGVLALVDAEKRPNPPPEILWENSSQLSVVFTTSPKAERWRAWVKDRFPETVISKAPDFQEALTAWQLYRVADSHNRIIQGAVQNHLKLLQDAWTHFGPDLRLGLKIMVYGLAAYVEHRRTVELAANSLDFENLSKLLLDGASGTEVTQKLVRSVPDPSSPTILVNRIRSQTVMRIVAMSYRKKDLAQRRQLYSALSTSTHFSTSLGWLFESMAIDKLSRGNITVELTSLTEINHQPLALKLTDRMVEIFPKRTLGWKTSHSQTFYVPAEGNNATWDAFFYYKDGQKKIGVGLQMTVGRKHTLNSDGLNALDSRFEAAMVTEFYFVFVTPQDYSFKLPKVTNNQEKRWRFFQLGLDVTDLDPEGEMLARRFREFQEIDKEDLNIDEMDVD